MFKDTGYQVVKNVVSSDLLDNLAIQFEMLRKVKYILNNIPETEDTKNAFNDNQVASSFAHYSAFFSESLLLQLQPIVEKVVGLTLHPTYSYSRIYYCGAEMKRHKDRPSCQYSATFCITHDPSNPWPIFFQKRDGGSVSFYLDPGDMLVYSGCDLDHWRDEYKGSSQMQTFLHYVDCNGPYKDFKYDKRQYLSLPKI